MDFGFYYRPDVNRVLFHYRPDDPAASPCCYDTVVSESRIVDYIGIARGQLPQKEYYGRWRSFPDTCDWNWQETKPIGVTRTYFGVPVFEGAYPYNGTLVTPSWGGSMFEALMPDLFVPEETWAPNSWGVNHPLTVQAQIHHGMVDAGYGVWGFSPSNTPEGGYGGYGVDAIGMDPNGSTSNEDHTTVDHGFAGCGRDRTPQPDPPPSAYTNGVVTPHAAFLALRFAPDATRADVDRARATRFPDMYGKWGFRDSVNVETGHVSGVLPLARPGDDHGRARQRARRRRAAQARSPDRRWSASLRPVIGIEQFGASLPRHSPGNE